MLEFIRYQKEGRIARIVLNRPEVLNALHPPAVQELNDVWRDFRDDPEVSVAIISGAGERAFCVGDDLKYRVQVADEEALRRSDTHPNYTPVECYKPVIAAVNGYALGGGFEIVLGCDIIVAAETARFGLPEARLGLLADAGGVVTLPRRVPYHFAMGMIMTGRMFSAAELYRAGLVNEVSAPDELMAAAERWAEEMLECSLLALKAAKQVIHKTADLPAAVAANMIENLSCVRELRASADYADGSNAFVSKEKPAWSGK